MKVKLLLEGNKAYSWTNQGDVYFIGYFFDNIGNLYKEQQAIDFILSQLVTSSYEDLVKTLSGVFSIVICGETIKIISDSVNFFPVFYSRQKDTIMISDNWNTLSNISENLFLNADAFNEFRTAGFVLKNETLAKNIFKTNANQILIFDDEKTSIIQYKQFLTKQFFEDSFEALEKKTEGLFLEVGERLVQFLYNRTAIVPLSGGYDSRLIVSILKKLNYEKVICFTYGKNNPEVVISKKVAETLGYQWFFVDFSELDVKSIQNEKEYSEYLMNMANGFSMPYLMEYFAMKKLLNDNAIPKDSVFLPGHSGDFLGGSYVLKTVKNSKKGVDFTRLIENNYFFFKKKNKAQCKNIQNRLFPDLVNFDNQTSEGYNMAVEEWDNQEKLSKFIFHSSHVFSFFGYEVYFPLWDKKMVDFFRNVPYSYRENKLLYDKVVNQYFFKGLSIEFNTLQYKNPNFVYAKQNFKDSIRYFFPWNYVLKRMKQSDWPDYYHLTANMADEINKFNNKEFKDFKSFNAIICEWYIVFLKKKYTYKSNNS